MKAMKCMLWLILTGALAVQADDAAFFRIRSASTAVVVTIDTDSGTLAWSNSVPEDNQQVQRAAILAPIADWQDYVIVAATGTVTSVQAFDLYPPANMILIPAGNFVMGNATNVFSVDEGYTSELPQHTASVSAFYMDQSEITKALWDEVYQWATSHGYAFSNAGSGKATNHPVQTVNWFDAVKWCNARSEKDGLTPCYYTSAALVTVYTNGVLTISNSWVNWSANGYRLPTEAEWEKATRGGVANHRFPWSDTDEIQHARANYNSSISLSYDTSPTRGFHPAYTNGGFPYSSPVGSFAPNGYGLYDMAGNVWEWCWDWYSAGYYNISPSTNPKGADTGSLRVLRGGSCGGIAIGLRVTDRNGEIPTFKYGDVGFRCVRGL